MSRQRPIGALTVLLFSSLLTLSCSRHVTCALEGCKPNNGVVLADDFKAGESADATAQKEDDLSKKIKDIMDRLGATEALAALLQETVKLHDTRIQLLEDKAKAVDSHLADIDGMIEHHEEEIHSQAKTIKALETSLTAKLEAQAAQEKADIEQLRLDLGSVEKSLKDSILSLDQAAQEDINSILEKMKSERAYVESADAAIANTAQENLNTLQKLLEGKISALELSDADILKTLTSEIARLDGRVSGVIQSTDREFRKLWTSYGLLQAQIILVAVDNELEHKRIRKEIDEVEALIRKEVAKLKTADQNMVNDILDLRTKQNLAQTQLNSLEKKVNDFITEQKATNLSISQSFTTLTGQINTLTTTLNNHVTTEADRVTTIVSELLVAITGRIETLETKSTDLQADLTNLEGAIEDVEEDFDLLQSSHNALRTEYDAFVITNNQELTQLNDLLTDVELATCTITRDDKGNQITLQCGTESVTLTTTGKK